MNKFRHSLSFFITAILYLALIYLYIFFLNITKPIKKSKPNRIKISIIEPKIVKIKPKPTIKPTIEPTIKPIVHAPIPIKPKIKKKHKIKPKHKKRVYKKRVKKIKRIKRIKKRVYKKIKHKEIKHKKVKKIKPTPKTTPKPIIREDIIEPKIVEIYTPSPKPKIQNKRAIQTPLPKIEKKVPINNLNNEKKRFLKKVRANIYANKHYPLKARRRRIEGVVHIVFDIEENGKATNIRISNASSILQRAVKQSLKKSFPIDIPNILKNKFPIRNISINIDFKLK